MSIDPVRQLVAAVVTAIVLLSLTTSVVFAEDEEAFPAHQFPSGVPTPPKPAPPPPPLAPTEGGLYKIQPGDVLTVSVWKESDLQSDVFVRPDGGLSFPLVGDINASGRSVGEVRALIDKRLRRVIADPEVTVSVKQIGGNLIYVVGKVNKPGNFPLNGPIDVLQALSLAGGTTPFASLNDIRIIRRGNGQSSAIPFRYHDIEKGHALEQNILLHSGDTVVVP